MSRKKTPKKKQQPSRSRTTSQLAEAEQLLARRKWEQAEEILRKIVHRQPSNREALSLLGGIYAAQQNGLSLWDVTEKLTRLEPHEPAHWANLALASMANGLPFAAVHYAGYFLERWPEHEYADEVREASDMARAACDKIIASDENSTPGASPEEYMLFELSQMAFNRGDFKQGEKIALEAAQRLPGAVPPLNNLALAYMLQGHLDQAAAAARQALERQPGNVHALSNLTQTLLRMGQREMAGNTAAELRQQPLSGETGYAKLFEALATLGDDAAIIETYDELEQSGEAKRIPVPTAHHLAAVAYARQGNVKRAQTLWDRTLKLDPHHGIARDNLSDLKKPIGERSGAWPFPIHHWMPQSWVEALLKAAERGQRSDTAMEREIKRVLRDLPYLEAVIPPLLERGDPHGRQLALMVAETADLPILRDFALSQNGTDQERMKAAQYATQLGLLPRGEPVRLFVKGRFQELRLLDYDIYFDPQPSTLPLKTQRLLEKAHDLLAEGRGVEAEATTREALELAPDHPPLLNYLMSALMLQNRRAEADEVVRRTVSLHPDYFFGRVALAQVYIREGRHQAAHEIVDGLMAQPRFHISEFAALCMVQIELSIAEKEWDGARQWIGTWEEVDPDNPNIPILRRRLLGRKFLR